MIDLLPQSCNCPNVRQTCGLSLVSALDEDRPAALVFDAVLAWSLCPCSLDLWFTLPQPVVREFIAVGSSVEGAANCWGYRGCCTPCSLAAVSSLWWQKSAVTFCECWGRAAVSNQMWGVSKLSCCGCLLVPFNVCAVFSQPWGFLS